MAIRAVTRSNPCPICGGPDWCGIMSLDDGGEAFVCQRNVDTLKPYKDGVMGRDGRYYICVGISKQGQNNIFEESSQRYAKDQLKKGLQVKNFDPAKIERRVLTPVDIISPQSNDKLDKVYRALLDMLILEPNHREYLLNEGWTDELIRENHIKSFPVEDFTRFKNKDNTEYFSKNPWRKTLGERLSGMFDLTGVPGAYKNKKGIWTFAGQSGILFPLYDELHQIYRLRVRLDHVSSGGKYRNFSSWKQDEDAAKQGFLMNKYTLGCQADNHLGFYVNETRDDMYICYITEGEKKGIIGEHLLKAPFISVPGVNSYAKLTVGEQGKRPIDLLSRKGVKMFIIAFDADKSVNAKVLASQQRTIDLLKAEGFLIGLAEWDAALGKGIDDLLVGGHKPSYVLA